MKFSNSRLLAFSRSSYVPYPSRGKNLQQDARV
jgi:hypothetical protein